MNVKLRRQFSLTHCTQGVKNVQVRETRPDWWWAHLTSARTSTYFLSPLSSSFSSFFLSFLLLFSPVTAPIALFTASDCGSTPGRFSNTFCSKRKDIVFLRGSLQVGWEKLIVFVVWGALRALSLLSLLSFVLFLVRVQSRESTRTNSIKADQVYVIQYARGVLQLIIFRIKSYLKRNIDSKWR